MIPFLIDTFVRVLVLGSRLEWYEIPDLVTFLATYSCFCLGVMLLVNPNTLPSDPEANATVDLVKVRLLTHSIFFVTLAIAISCFRAVNEALPHLHLYREKGIFVMLVVAISATLSFAQISSTYLSYVNRD